MPHVDLPRWRDDPIESFSDWKIEIIVSSDDHDNIVETYHVHKTFLAHGSRKSEYFSRLFRSDERFKENQSSTSQIELDPLAARAFPDLLDYVYGADLSIAAETATALHHLGEYFEISELQDKSLEFCEENMTLDTLHVYYVAAKQLCDELVMNLVTDFLREFMEDVLPTHAIVTQSSPHLWIDALGLNPGNKRLRIYDTSQLSLVIAKMCTSQSEETMDAETFHTLADSLTLIDPTAALDLCELADRYRLEDANYGAIPGLHLFQERCASTMSNRWRDLDGMEDTQVDKMLQRSPEFLVSLLMQSLRRASRDVDKLSNELADSEKLLIAAQRIQWR